MTSARERAVEAGARAFEDVSEWPAKTYRERAMSAAILAAFPILAEELVEIARNSCLYGSDGGEPTEGERLVAERAAEGLRARIQQMAEAEHE